MILLTVQKDMKNHPFLIEKSSHTLNVVLATPAQLLCPETDFFLSKYKNTEKPSFFQFFSLSHFFSWHVGWSFRHPAVNFWQCPEHFRSKYENQSKIIVFPNKTAQKIPLETPNAAMTTPAKLLRPEFNFFRSKYKITKTSSFFQFSSPSQIFSWHVDWSFGNLQ